jgi:hypothetical protein
MFFFTSKEKIVSNHHGDSINPEFAEWIVDFISHLSQNLLYVVFTFGIIFFIVFSILILFFSRKNQKK